MILVTLALLAATSCGTGVSASGDSTSVGTTCELTPTEVHQDFLDPGHEVRLKQHCAVGGAASCRSAALCAGGTGHLYDVLVDGTLEGFVCLSPSEYTSIDEPWPGDVESAIATQRWPPATLIVQPPGGRTLVNLPTNFYTTSTASLSADVDLLGVTTALTLTPRSYTWHFGDGTSVTTSSPGRAYPSMTNTHTYRRIGLLGVSIDVTYTVRYRVRSQGRWRTLTTSVSVAGSRQRLEVVPATPLLAG